MARKKNQKSQFTFEISLSVLNHLGRNLYRSFVTVLGEAISNSWDADANNVWISIEKDSGNLVIKDDGVGMTSNDFQNKFLRIGYSKRSAGKSKSGTGRPFIGRKGIGKLALLSCASRIAIISKTNGKNYVGGVIDNSGLDEAILHDLTPDKYSLEQFDNSIFSKYQKGHKRGTIVYFQGIHGGIKNSLTILRKIIALYFRFSLVDKSFNIYIDDVKITHDDLKDLAEKTEFLWKINSLTDPFIKKAFLKGLKEEKNIKTPAKIKGFIASVDVPKSLKIMNMEERVTVDLFVNGRLREKDILKHIPSARIVEDYLYGQIHFDGLDDKTKDRFTSDREGVISDDPKYKEFLNLMRTKILNKIFDDWDKLRLKHKKSGDIDNKRLSPKERSSRDLFNVVSSEFTPDKGAPNKDVIDKWVDDLTDDAQYNFTSYADCFISENLVRNFINKRKIPLSGEAVKVVERWKKAEVDSKNKGNISIDIRRSKDNLVYLDMDDLCNLFDKARDLKLAALSRDADQYKPMRDAVAHTALLTDGAKKKLSTVYDNIRGRLRSLFASVDGKDAPNVAPQKTGS